MNFGLESVELPVHILYGIFKKIIMHDIGNQQYQKGGE